MTIILLAPKAALLRNGAANTGAGRGDGIDVKLAIALAVLVAEAEKQILADASIELDRGAEAVG